VVERKAGKPAGSDRSKPAQKNDSRSKTGSRPVKPPTGKPGGNRSPSQPRGESARAAASRGKPQGGKPEPKKRPPPNAAHGKQQAARPPVAAQKPAQPKTAATKPATRTAARAERAEDVQRSEELTPAQAQQAANADLWARFTATDSAALREQLILQYAPLVKYVIGRLAISLPTIVDYEDILSYGTIGLIEAVERFDPDKGVKFETYAIARIRGAIIDALRSLDRLPRSVRQKAKNADAAINQLTVVLGRDPTDQEVAQALGIPIDRYLKDIIDASWVTVSLDTVGAIDGDDDGPAEIPVADPESDAFTQALEQEELIGELTESIQELPEREQLVLSLYYKEELTMREISEVLGVSESRVCQLHARSLTRLRAGLAARQQHGEAA
jgi:RNA polymerase sigma factor for flagellar operon FliA